MVGACFSRVGWFMVSLDDGKLGDIDRLACLATTSAKLRGLNCGGGP